MHEIVFTTCGSCGTQLDPGSRYCSSCGTGSAGGAAPMRASDQNEAVSLSPVGEKIKELADQVLLKIKAAWGTHSMQAPIAALGSLMLSLLLPVWVTIGAMDGGASWAPSSLAGLGVAMPLVFGLAIFAGIVANSTGTRYGSWPLIAATTASFIAAVLSTSVVAFLPVVSALVGEIPFVGGDLTIGIGPYLAMLSSATLLVLLLRLPTKNVNASA